MLASPETHPTDLLYVFLQETEPCHRIADELFHAQELKTANKLISLHTGRSIHRQPYIKYTSERVSAVITQLHYLTMTKSKGGGGGSGRGVGGGENCLLLFSQAPCDKRSKVGQQCARGCVTEK